MSAGESKLEYTTSIGGLSYRFGRVGDNAYVETSDGHRYVFVRWQELELARFFNERRPVDPPQPDRPEPVDPASGAGRIAAERERQASDEGYTPEHDDRHDGEQLARAAATYLLRDHGRWPWSFPVGFTPGDRVRDLVKAGALIAAEIDRLQRAEPEPDEAAVEALAAGLVDQYQTIQDGKWRDAARALIRDHGVHVEVSE